MNRLLIIAILAACMTLMSLGGCKDKTDEDSESNIVKTDAEYKEQAEKEITKDNMLEELDKLENSIDQDTTK